MDTIIPNKANTEFLSLSIKDFSSVIANSNRETAITAYRTSEGQLSTTERATIPSVASDTRELKPQHKQNQQERVGSDNFSNNFNRNFAKIRLHDPDLNPRPRRQFQTDTSSRYYNKNDGNGPKRGGDDDRFGSAGGNGSGSSGVGTGNGSGSFGSRNTNYYRTGNLGGGSPDYQRSSGGGRLNASNNDYNKGKYESDRSEQQPPRFRDNYYSSGAANGASRRSGQTRSGFVDDRTDKQQQQQRNRSRDHSLERSGQAASLKTEAQKQTVPESRAAAATRENNVTPSVDRWIPPSLRPQHGLTVEAKNDVIFRKVRGILNKLTPDKFQKLSDDLLKIDLNSTSILNGVIILIFEKALDEPKYSSMYAQLCKRLSEEAPNFDSPSKGSSTFLHLLLNVCRDRFLKRTVTGSENFKNDSNGPLTPDEEEKRHLAKERMLGNVKFIGELNKLQMLSQGVLHKCIQQLLEKRNRTNPTIQDRCEDMECLSQLIRTCGKNLDTEEGKKLMDQYFDKLDKYSKSSEYPPRIRFMLRDVIELRNNNWTPRRVQLAEGPVPIRQIRNEDDNLMRPPYMNRNRDVRNNERGGDNWMNRFSLNLQPGSFNDMFLNLSVSSPSHILSSGGGNSGGYNNSSNNSNNNSNNRHHQQRNNQQNNHHNNYNNRFNKHNSNQQNSHNNSSYPSMNNMMNNKDLAPRFKRNLMQANQDPVENLQMRPSQNTLLFKANINMKAPPLMPMQTTPTSSSSAGTGGTSSPVNLSNSSSANSTPPPIQQNLSINNRNTSGFSNTILTRPIPSTALNSETQHVMSQNSVNLNPSGTLDVTTGNKDETVAANSNKQTEKTGKQNKKDKGPNKEESLKRVQTFLKEHLIIDASLLDEKNIDDTLEIFFELRIAEKFMKDSCILLLNETVDKSEQQIDRSIEFLQLLRKNNKISANALLEAFRQLIKSMNEKEATIPKITSLVASLLAKAITAKLTKINEIAAFTEHGQHYPLLLLVLQNLHKILGKAALTELYNQSKVNLMTTLPQADQNKDRMAEILEDRDLSFLYPLLKLQSEMLKEIQSEPNPNSFFKWIKDRVESKFFTDVGFITALMTVLLKYITGESTLIEGTDLKKTPEKSVIEKEHMLLEKYCNILNAFLLGKNDQQLIAIYALQVFCYTAKFPKGLLCRWFTNLYDLNVIEEETFIHWKEEINDTYPGKCEALFQVNTWLTWLEQAESEDED